ncbi:MAG: hypothetical protein H6837_21690 [Planctomycetes bacterium]|nr:hypothetical protein [Planctomycetota bacterium]
MTVDAGNPRDHEAAARQCFAETRAAVGVQSHAGPDRRERVLNHLVESSLHAYEEFRRAEQEWRLRCATGAVAYQRAAHTRWQATGQLHLGLGHALVAQLDQAAVEGLTVRNTLPFRLAYAELLAMEMRDHGVLDPALLELASEAVAAHRAGETQPIDSNDTRNGVLSFRTWDFIKRTAALDPELQHLAERRYRTFFAVDDRHPALTGRPVLVGRSGTREAVPAVWAVEIRLDCRALAVLPTGADERVRTYVWFWIGR